MVSYTEWISEKYRSRQKCRVIETLICRPIQMDSFCTRCYEREAMEDRGVNMIMQTRTHAEGCRQV